MVRNLKLVLDGLLLKLEVFVRSRVWEAPSSDIHCHASLAPCF
jgi:hypothetical protein